MFQVTIDGTAYVAYATAEDAEAARAGLRRWASTSTRIAVVAAKAGAPCARCGGTGEVVRLLWVGARGGWVHGPGVCRACRGTGSAGEEVASDPCHRRQMPTVCCGPGAAGEGVAAIAA